MDNKEHKFIIEDIVGLNGLNDKIVLIEKIKEISEKLDVIVGDFFGNMIFNSSYMRYLVEAKEKLKEEGVIMPDNV